MQTQSSWPGCAQRMFRKPIATECGQFPKIGTWKKMKFRFFFRQRHALSTSFDIFVVAYRVTNFLPKLINILLFSATYYYFLRKKTEFPFFEIPYFRALPECVSRLPFLTSSGGKSRFGIWQSWFSWISSWFWWPCCQKPMANFMWNKL